MSKNGITTLLNTATETIKKLEEDHKRLFLEHMTLRDVCTNLCYAFDIYAGNKGNLEAAHRVEMKYGNRMANLYMDLHKALGTWQTESEG